MNQITPLLSVLLLLAGSLRSQNPVASVEGQITPASVAAPIRFLSHDLLEGRGVGSRGDRLARLYIATSFQLYGLRPGAADGEWEQPVPIIGINARIARPLTATGKGGRISFEAPRDYVVFAGRPDERTAFENAEVVFVGYGITAPEEEWDDFKDVDVKGKVLLVMNNDPSSSPDLFAGKTRLYYGRWTYKYEEAARRGAVGAMIIHTTPSAGYPFDVIRAGHGKEDFHLPFREGQPTLAVQSWCSEEAARKICSLGGHDLDALRRSAESRDFKPVPLGVRLDLETRNQVRELRSANVLGRLEGSDPRLKEEVIVVTAHFDHLGRGRPLKGDDIYNGALDNASGSSALLNLARACAALSPRPRRSLLFAAVTAEESGLLGSRFLAENPPCPIKRIVADFNIDGINIWGPTKSLEMIGYGKNSLTALAETVAAGRGRKIKPDADVDKGLFYRSDHFSFAKVGVPSAYFKAGNDFLERPGPRLRLKRSYVTVRYHKPSDEYDPRWRLTGAVEDLRLILECIVRCANADAPPTWTPGDEFEKLR